jgi:hypothetical protein
MQNRVFAWVLICVGVLLVLISALAYALGLSLHPGFGWKKTLGVVVGTLIIVAGLYLGPCVNGRRSRATQGHPS